MPHLATCAALLAAAGTYTASSPTTPDPALLRFLLQRGGPEYGTYPEDHPNYSSWIEETEVRAAAGTHTASPPTTPDYDFWMEATDARDQEEMDAQMEALVEHHERLMNEPTSFTPDHGTPSSSPVYGTP